MHGKAIIVMTSNDTLGDTGRPTGFHWSEMTTPYWALRDAGMEVTLASPKGGEPPVDPGSAKGDLPDSVTRFQEDAQAMAALKDTAKVSDLDPAETDLVYLPGGHGTMWDLPGDDALADLIGTVYDRGAFIAAICHGPAGLIGATRADGRPVVEGHAVNCFTDAEEYRLGLNKTVPFLLESRLSALGARVGGGAPFAPFAVRDGQIMTGQNPASAEPLGAIMVNAVTTMLSAVA
jgi:putative intracellular protease/amidase